MDDLTLTAKYRIIPPYRFEDVPAGSWYEPAVRWALENYVVTGFTPTVFGPGRSCTRAQAVTFLYRMQPQR